MQPMSNSTRVPRRSPILRAALGLCLGLAALAFPDSARAQDGAEPDAWKATAELSFTDASGNQDLSLLTTGFTLEHRRPELYALDLNVRARYGSSNGETDIENYQGELNLDLGPSDRLSPFLHSTAERDPTRHLDVRVNTGAGAKYKLYRADHRGEAALSVALLHSYEAYEAVEGTEPDTDKPNARWSLRLDGNQEINDGVTLSHSTSYEPVYGALDDYLLSLQTSLKVMVTSRVALSISHEFDRDSTPPSADVEPDDRLLKAGILVEL